MLDLHIKYSEVKRAYVVTSSACCYIIFAYHVVAGRQWWWDERSDGHVHIPEKNIQVKCLATSQQYLLSIYLDFFTDSMT
jgi:hypothetical protein